MMSGKTPSIHEPPWVHLGITESEWRALAGAFYNLAHNDFKSFHQLPDRLRENPAGRLCARYIETGDHEFVEQAGRMIAGTKDWYVSLGRMM